MISSIITLFFASVLRIRISRQIFEHSEKKAFFITTLYTLVGVAILTLLSVLHTSQVISNVYYIIILGIIIIIGASIPSTRYWLGGWFIQSIIRFLQIIGGYSPYTLAARSEESIKRGYIKKYTDGRLGTIILLGIVSGIAFGRSENILYGIMGYLHNDIAINIISKRAFVPIILHSGTVCISGLISYSIAKKGFPLLGRSIGLGGGILLHYLFNISQIQGYSSAIILILLICIGTISYSFFRSDTLYIPANTIK